MRKEESIYNLMDVTCGKLVFDIDEHDDYDEPKVEYFTDGSYVLLQYTGLKDKNWVEIYEGDIVITPSGNKFVKWLDDESRFAVCSDGKCIKSFNSLGNYCDDAKNLTCSRLEVIGNIYEHPHLLEAKNA